jgi:hypothetical protein
MTAESEKGEVTGGHSHVDPSSMSGGLADTPNQNLQNVLQQVLAVTERDARLSPSDRQLREELLETTAALQGCEFGLDPVLLSLVGVITRRVQPLSSAQEKMMRQSVAQTLFDDVASRVRIERLWEQLKRLSANEE